MDARKPSDVTKEVVSEAQKVATFVCVVQTMVDLVPRDNSLIRVQYIGNATSIRYNFRIDCVSANLLTGEGLEDVFDIVLVVVLTSRCGIFREHVTGYDRPFRPRIIREHMD